MPVVRGLSAALVLLTLSVARAGFAGQADVSVPTTALTQAETEHFLKTARIVAHRSIPKGTTRPVRVTLSDGRLRHDAAFSSVDERKPVMTFAGGRTEFDFVDTYRYSLAAYRVARLLGVDGMMPVTVERTWNQQHGALSWWIDAKWDEAARLREQLLPPDPEAWDRQALRMRVFAMLVADTDRNLGNVLITSDWKLWMIDFTRAFRHTRQLPSPDGLTRCDRQLLATLRTLNRAEVETATGRYLGRAEIAAMMARRDLMVAVFDRRIAALGEASVLY